MPGPGRRRGYPGAGEIRGGEIVLRARWQRLVRLAGLVPALLLGLVLAAIWMR